MNCCHRLVFSLCFALLASTSFSAPSLAQKGETAALSAKINELSRAGKYAEAVALAQGQLDALEKKHGPAHRDFGAVLNNLAQLFGSQGRDAEAEPMFRRAIAILEKSAGSESPENAAALNNLAALYQRQERYAEAEPLFSRALAIYEKVAGPEHPAVATVLNNLGQVAKDQQQFAKAEPLIKRSLAIREKVLGRDHPDVARSLNNLADLYDGPTDRVRDAERLFERALAIRESTLGPDHPDTAKSLNNLALFEAGTGYPEKGLPLALRLVANGRAEPRAVLPVLSDAERNKLIPTDQAVDAMLNVIQRSTQSSAASAVNKLAVRLAAGNDRLAELVRRDQDLAAETEALDKALVTAVSKERSKRDPAEEQRVKARLAAIATERPSLQKRLSAEFPGYAALSNPLPMTVKEIQSLLSDDEAMVLLTTTVKDSFVIAITREGFDWSPIGRGSEGLYQLVADFRRGLNVSNAADASGKSSLFNLESANWLYNHLLGRIEPRIRDKRSLLIVPTGALTALPFHLLVTEKPPAAIPETLDGYRNAAWLLKRHAVSVLPSVASLKALRGIARKDQATKPMTGFGDPLFNPLQDNSGDKRGAEKPAASKSAARGVTSLAYTDFWKGAGVDRTKLSQVLLQLPDTADELNAVARDLGVPKGDIHLGEDASETTVKRTPLADYSIVYFATHGLVAGDVKGIAEPSLVLSIPKQPSELDDGLLTSSEVAQLKLNADWVVLSACNTIAGDRPGAEALSGLARSFFYAGARALLVSHWAVDSAAATRLTTSTFDRLKADPKLGRAEALRQAMLAYLNDTSSPKNAYPAYWGPFALIGEGATR